MEEIPGPQTLQIINERIVETLSRAIPAFRPVYPSTKSYRINTSEPLSRCIDHTLLKPTASRSDFVKLCQEARSLNVWSVCVPSNRVSLASEELIGSGVRVCTVVGFPMGYASTEAKVAEAKAAISRGATELDMVISIGLLKDEDLLAVFRDIRAVVEAAGDVLVKVILETSELSLEEKIQGSYLSCYAGAGYLKTSTGFASGGAVLDDLYIMRVIAGDRVGVKASGGIRSLESLRACLKAGADRIGASATAAILASANGIGSTEPASGGY